jgi:hypothetical protein
MKGQLLVEGDGFLDPCLTLRNAIKIALAVRLFARKIRNLFNGVSRNLIW